MKVIQDIIDYLAAQNVITQDDVNYLQKKGYYKLVGDDWWIIGAWPTEEEEDEYKKEMEENKKDLESIFLEKQLEDDRRKKKGKKSYFTGAKKRHIRNQKATVITEIEKQSDFWWYPSYLDFNDIVINDFLYKHRFGKKYCQKLYSLEDHYPKINNFWDSLIDRFGLNLTLKWSDEIIEILIKREKCGGNQAYIKPKAFYKLKESDQIVNESGWALSFKLDENAYVSLTDEEGKQNLHRYNK